MRGNDVELSHLQVLLAARGDLGEWQDESEAARVAALGAEGLKT